MCIQSMTPTLDNIHHAAIGARHGAGQAHGGHGGVLQASIVGAGHVLFL
jgi:hypothetical protein